MARIFFVTIFALLFGILLARQPTLQDLQAAKQATYDKLTTLWGVKPSDLKVVAQEGRRLQSVSGFMFATTYAGEKCHGQKRADLVVGYATDVCLASKKVSGYSARSFIFTCTDGQWNMATYNNYNCKGSGYIGTSVLEVPTNGECGLYPPEGTADDDDQDDDGTLQITQARYYCESGSEANLMSNYILEKYYDSTDCTKLGAFNGNRNEGCMAFGMEGERFSVYTEYPFQTYFANGDCSGQPVFGGQMDDLEDTCTSPPMDDDPSVDDMRWSGYTSEITCSVPDNSECSYPGTEKDNTPLKTGQVAGLVFGTIGGFAIVIFSAYLIFLYVSATKGAEAGAGEAAAAGKV